MGILVGGLFGVGLAFGFEYLDNRIRNPEEIKTHLGVAFLGCVPRAAGLERNEAALISDDVPPAFLEAIRSVRTNLLFSSAEEGTRSILVSSTGPGEGKTVIASNLAISIAQAGQRVLLIDADMRRSRIQDVFGIDLEPGLSNMMAGAAKASEAIRPSAGVKGLWLLPAGRVPPNPPELLGSRRFHEFIETLREHFDWVIIDSPPVMAVTDSAVLAHSVSEVLFVVGSDRTSRHTARIAVEQLQSTRGRLIGAVLNQVDLERNPYYYSRYYHRDYQSYYTRSA